MLKRFALAAALLVAAAPAFSQDKHKDHHTAPVSVARTPAFEKFRDLAGDWVGTEKGPNGGDVAINFKLTAGGTSVVETEFPGTDMEMVTVIHPDGDDLALTHYCMVGNQPQMKAPGKLDGNKVAFKFVKVTNLTDETAMHMHDVTYTFIDKDTISSEWTHYVGGKSAGNVVFNLKRKK